MPDRIKQLFKSRLARNSAASGLLKPLSMLISYVYVPIVLKYLGEERYGAWAAILSVVSWISFFDIGIGNGLRNKLTAALANNEKEKCRKLISSAYLMLTKIVAVSAGAMILVSMLLDWNSILGLKEGYAEMTAAVVISIGFVSLNFVLSMCKNVLFAMQQASLSNLIDVTGQLINLAGILIVSLFSHGSLLAVSLVSGGSSVAASLIFSAVLYTKHRELMPLPRFADRAVGREVTSLGLKFFVIQICALVLYTTDSLIISGLYGAESVTPYSIVNKLFTAVIGVHSAFMSPVWSAVTKARSENNRERVRQIVRISTLMMLPFMAAGIGIAVLFRPFTSLWLGQELEYSTLLILLGGVYCVFSIWCNTFGLLSNGMSIMRIPMTVAVIQAALNIPLSLLFAERFSMGPEGILLGTVSVMIIGGTAVTLCVKKAIGQRSGSDGKNE